MRSTIVLPLIVAAFMLGTQSPTAATVFDLIANMDGGQANAGNGTGSLGIGTGIISYDDVSTQLDWEVSWSGLTGNPTAMHFHGPALPDQNAGVQVGIGIDSNPAIGSAILDAQQASDLLSGLWYINLHTTAHPGGEIRGQVNLIPEPASLGIFICGAIIVSSVRRRPSL